MLHRDRIYGQVELGEPAVLELIESKAIQRLKGVDQAGYPPLYYNPRGLPVSRLAHNRFEHSLGVYCLLKKFGAPIAEQIAGLIHDASHAAFSHCIDYVLDSGSEKEQNHQDNVFKSFVEKSEIPAILRKNNFDPAYILDEHNFPLLEKSLPDLCADRIDYSLRTAVIFQEINRQDLNYLLENLLAENKQWVFKDFASAKRYAELFLKMNTFYYAGLSSAVMFRAVGDTLRHALGKGYISESDLNTTDKEVLDKIERNLATDERLKLLFDRMNNKVKFENNPQNYDARVFCKSRAVDPFFKDGESVKRVSEADEAWLETLEKESKPKEYFIKFER